jgi:hypothetical protein
MRAEGYLASKQQTPQARKLACAFFSCTVCGEKCGRNLPRFK